MNTLPSRAGRRCAAALAAALGCAVMAHAQTTAPVASPAIKDTALPSFPFTQPGAKSSAPNVPETAPARSTAVSAWPRWLAWPRLLAPHRAKIVDPCEHCGSVPPSADELLRVQSGQASLVEIAATKIKTDESGAPARRAAIRYLASVRCHYFPEAEAALIAALRCDRNECVRVDAAQALAGGCCCTSKTLEALLLACSSSERDGNPAETSERVKVAANAALQHYAARGMSVPHPDTLPPANQKTPKETQFTSPAKMPPRELQLTSFTMLPEQRRLNPTIITDAERRFAETAGLENPAATGPRKSSESSLVLMILGPRSTVAVPAIRLQPIGVIPSQDSR